MQQYLEVKADSNDADYVTSRELVTDEQLKAFAPIFKAIKEFKPYKVKLKDGYVWTHTHNYATWNCHREDLNEKTPENLYVDSGVVSAEIFEEFQEFVPSIEGGIHTIDSIKLIKVIEEIELV